MLILKKGLKCSALLSFITIISFLILNNVSSAQVVNNSLTDLIPFGSNSNFLQIQESMSYFWDSKNIQNGFIIKDGLQLKVPNWKLYKRWEYFWEQRVNLQSGQFPSTNSAIEYEKYKNDKQSLNKSDSFNENWVNLGSNSSTGGYSGLGRINCIAFHPTDNNIFWVGSPSGGVWKTTDGGSSWAVLNDYESVLGVSDISIPSDYLTSNTIYIATGDRDGQNLTGIGEQTSDNVSIGVLKSTNGGTSWSTTGLTFLKSSGNKITRLLIDPTDNQILFASVISSSSTVRGIYKSTDGGTTWSRKTDNTWIDLEFIPGNHNILIASSYGYGSSYINRSTNNGETWSFYPVSTGGYRNEIAVTSADPTRVYMISALSNSSFLGIYKSTDSGSSFSLVRDSTLHMLNYYSDGSDLNVGQGTYDLTIACSPGDANEVYIGGVNTWKSTDGGANWIINNMWTSSSTYNKTGVPVVHADKHLHAFQNSSNLYEGNDGGIYRSTDGGTTWTDLTNGMVINQIYRIGLSQTDQNVQLAGLQDNGSKKYTGELNTWVDVHGGDGMECIVDFNNATSYMYVTYVSGQIYRNSNGYNTFSETKISANIPGGQPVGAWVTPYIMDPTNAAILYAGYDKIWKTTDRGDSWVSISQVLSSSNKLRSLAIAQSNTNILYTADRTNMWKTTDAGASNWSSITLPTTANYLTYIAVKNNDPNTVWITFGGYNDTSKVYQSTDGGSTWTNISTGLPNLPIMCIVYYKDVTDRDILFVGTDVGVYVKDGTNNWAAYNSNLPNVVVTELEIFYGGSVDKLRAGTFGRGLWETDINAPLPVELSSFTGKYIDDSIILDWKTETEVNNYGFEVERKSDNKSDNWGKLGFVNGNGNSNSPKYYSFKDENINFGTYYYRLKQIDNDGKFEFSKIIDVSSGLTPGKYSLNQNYPNPFNPVTTISYQIKDKGLVELVVYNILGQKVETLVDEIKSAGYYSIDFKADDLPSGTYIFSLSINNFIQNRKMILTK